MKYELDKIMATTARTTSSHRRGLKKSAAPNASNPATKLLRGNNSQ